MKHLLEFQFRTFYETSIIAVNSQNLPSTKIDFCGKTPVPKVRVANLKLLQEVFYSENLRSGKIVNQRETLVHGKAELCRWFQTMMI